MKIPNKVKIGGIVYDIEQTEHRSEGENILLGEISYSTGKIYLNETIRHDILAQTFFHEVVHGCLYAMGSKLNDNEKFVEGISQQLYQVMVDNGWTFGGDLDGTG